MVRTVFRAAKIVQSQILLLIIKKNVLLKSLSGIKYSEKYKREPERVGLCGRSEMSERE